MFDIGGGELLLIGLFILLLFGPKKIPEVMGNVARGYRHFMRAQEEVKQQFRDLGTQAENTITGPVQSARTQVTDSIQPALSSTLDPTSTATASPAVAPALYQPVNTVSRMPRSYQAESTAVDGEQSENTLTGQEQTTDERTAANQTSDTLTVTEDPKQSDAGRPSTSGDQPPIAPAT